MKDICFDEGIIQAFLDGELSSDLSENVARHVALCDLCALLLQESEEESAFAFAALDNEFNTLVPTERIRTNLYQAISEIENPRISFWQRLLNIGAIFSNPSIAAFASLLVVAGLALLAWDINNQTSENTIAKSAVQGPSSPKPILPVLDPSGETVQPAIEPNRTGIERVSSQNIQRQPKIENAVYRVPTTDSRQFTKAGDRKVTPTEAVSGEDSYIKTIATLTETVDSQKDATLMPSARVAFEKDLAIVDDTISKMKNEVRKNPKNDAAKQVLKNSYQNKIDLLNSVTEKSDLMATLK